MENGHLKTRQYLTEDNIKTIVNNYSIEYNASVILKNYEINLANDKLLGFLSDYWKLRIVIDVNGEPKNVHFFLKAISRSNESRASIAKEWKVFDKETYYFHFMKTHKIITGLKPWSAKLIANFDDDILVFEDLSKLQYGTRNKLERFDVNHTLRALQTLANFHASSLIFEENRRRKFHRSYRISDEFDQFSDEGGYRMTDLWFNQCMTSALDIIKAYSKYGQNEKTFAFIKEHWSSIWSDALQINHSSEERSVLCHRDLWNNNIMFRYDEKLEPVDCMLVDFQGTRYQPLAGDVMVLLYCNLDPKLRENNMNMFLDFYYDELSIALSNNSLHLDELLPKSCFLKSAKNFRTWGLIVNACLLPQNCLDDEMMIKYFSDTDMFQDILTKSKTRFINDLILENKYEYKRKILEVFEEIVESSSLFTIQISHDEPLSNCQSTICS